MTADVFNIAKEMPRFRTRADVEAYLPNIKNERTRAYVEEVSSLFSHYEGREDPIMERLGIASPSEMTVHYALKEYFNEQGMFAFVSERWITPFVEWIGQRKVLEVMSGAGHIAYALRERGVDIRATDDMTWAERRGWDLLTKVERWDAVAAVDEFGPDVDIVLMSWPYMDDTAFNVLERLHKVNPLALVVYIGEWGGCTADESFFKHFGEIEDDEKFNEAARKYQHWAGLHDRLYLGRYRE
ncbi:response regulator [Paenibacillus hexagrammi]|uniref:SAM-dependent methyltransferase n=1 Tax=Paenibacillus hexagrammi TaxID=2908839 RepID=A0ABY3STN4_9BACL|nr:hypothetical protein [Paenibacillus sp. YPD9-1]UJF36609.1 hypothetical protein L0M14_30435 [Paenibacillus sp. YPD9-1]